MQVLSLILFLLVAALWFLFNEYDSLFGVYTPTCAVRRRTFNILVFFFLALGLFSSGYGAVEESVTEYFKFELIDSENAIIILLSSLIVLSVLKLFSVRGSSVYALLGALSAYGVVASDSLRLTVGLLGFFVAPLLAFLLSAVWRTIFRLIFSKIHIHMIAMSYYMRQAVIVCIILTAFALGINWGGLLYGIGGMIATATTVRMLTILIACVMTVVFMRLAKEPSEEPSGIFADFSIYAVVSVGISVVAVLLFFSFEPTTSLIGLCPVPLSTSSLVIAAIAGVEVAQKSRLVDNNEYSKESIAVIASPICSFVLTYLILFIISGNSGDKMIDFVVMTVAILTLMAIAFAGYLKRQRSQREATDKLVYSQQQQIYEHSRALNDMELKVVLSENQALHDAVETKKQEVMNIALGIVEQKEFLESLNDMVKRLSKTDDQKERNEIISEMSSALKQRLSYERDVDSQYFYAQAESLHEDFNAKLAENFPNMTPQERRLATLLRLGFSSKYIATLMNITPKSVEISRYRLRQKLGLGKGDNLVNFIKSI